MLSTGRPQLPSDIAASRVSGPKQTRAARNTYPEDSESPTSDATSKSVERTTSTGRSQPLLAGAGKRVMSKGSSNTSRTTATAVPSTDLNKAAEAARNDVNEESAIAWAQEYVFPSEYLASDLGCLCAAQLDFVAMVRRRYQWKTLSSNHIQPPQSPESSRAQKRQSRNITTNGTRGMHVPLPTGFTPNGKNAPSPLRTTYVAVALAVNKMLGELVVEKLAFLLPYDDGRRYVPNLHLSKAHWTRK